MHGRTWIAQKQNASQGRMQNFFSEGPTWHPIWPTYHPLCRGSLFQSSHSKTSLFTTAENTIHAVNHPCPSETIICSSIPLKAGHGPWSPPLNTPLKCLRRRHKNQTNINTTLVICIYWIHMNAYRRQRKLFTESIAQWYYSVYQKGHTAVAGCAQTVQPVDTTLECSTTSQSHRQRQSTV